VSGDSNDHRADSELLDRLRAAQRMEFVGVAVTGVIHDLNNLLTALGGTVEILRLGQAADPALLDSLEGMLRRSRDVTGQLLRAARPGDERKEALDLRKPVRQAADLLRNSFGAKVRIHKSLPSTQLPVMVDRTALLQSLFNLGVNARQAMGGAGDLFLELEEVSDIKTCRSRGWPGLGYSRLRVSDTGPGIPAGARDRLFEPFFSTKGPEGGTGMGLAVVARTVRDHDGRIGLVDLEGRGATFQIELPIWPGSVEDDEPTRAMTVPSFILKSGGKPPLHDVRVLVADDEPSLRLLLESSLTSRGAIVETVTNGRHAVDAARGAKQRGEPFETVLLDLRMPGGGGAEALGPLREIDPYVRLIVTSGLSPSDEEQDAIDEHGAKFLGKPFGLVEVVEALLTS